MKINHLYFKYIAVFIGGCFIGLFFRDGCFASSRIYIGRFQHQDLQGKAPAGWQLQLHKGRPALAIEQDGRQTFLRLFAGGQTAFGVKKNVSVDIRTYPFLQWRWRVHRLPDGGDIRRADRDDQALQLYVVFPSVGFPALQTSPTISYIWDNEAPKGLMIRSPQKMLGYVRYVVLRTRSDGLGVTQTETRNVYDDYRRLFPDVNEGKPPGPVRTVLIFINTHHTKSAADGSIGDIVFSANGK